LCPASPAPWHLRCCGGLGCSSEGLGWAMAASTDHAPEGALPGQPPAADEEEVDPLSEPDSPTTGKKKKPKPRAWVNIEGPEGQKDKVRVKIASTVNELRKAVSAQTGVKMLELQMQIGKRHLEEARIPAFEGPDTSKVVVRWWKADRTQAIIDKRKLGELNGRGWLGRTLVHYVVLDADYGLVTEVLNNDALETNLVNVRDTLGDTALMFASVAGYFDIVDLLLDRQAEMEHQNLLGRTALMLASEHGHAKVVNRLLYGGVERGPKPPNERRDELYLAELNKRESVVTAIRVYDEEKVRDATFNQ